MTNSYDFVFKYELNSYYALILTGDYVFTYPFEQPKSLSLSIIHRCPTLFMNIRHKNYETLKNPKISHSVDL